MRKIFLSFVVIVGNLSSNTIRIIDQRNWVSGFDIGAFFVNSGDVIVDVGANIGGWTKRVLKKTKRVHAYLFEPVPSIFKRLEENFLNNNNVMCYQLALHDHVGFAEFYINVTHEGVDTEGSSLFLTHDFLTAIPVTVPVDTLDNFCTKNSIDHIAFLKIDAESADPYVIYGARNMILNKAIDIIQFEYGKDAYRVSNTSFLALYQFLSNNDYLVFLINNDGTITQQNNGNPYVDYGDFLAIRKEKLNFFTS